jgi:2-polyprenyl-6-methoxyphenol hydroxylase-like FAD-dependent oxidoreductase
MHKFTCQCSQLQDFLECIARQLASRPWYTTGNSVEVSSLHVGRVVLLGDAAHAISPVMGQVELASLPGR